MKKIRKQAITMIKLTIPLFILSIIFISALGTVSADQGIIYVNNDTGNDDWDGQSATYDDITKSGPKLSIKNATGTVTNNGIVHIARGNYSGVNNTGIVITKNMALIGENQEETVINGSSNRIFTIQGNLKVLIQNLTFTNGKSDDGGAIYSDGNLTVENCTFTSNYATGWGGAICSHNYLTVENCNFTSNVANMGGAIMNHGINCTVTGSIFTNNHANNNGYGGAAICSFDNSILNAHFNCFISNTGSVTIYSNRFNTQFVENNWWGSNSSPASQVAIGVYYAPWLILQITPNPDSIYTGQTSTVTADLNHNWDGANNILDVSALGHVYDGIPVNFALTNGPYGTLTEPVTRYTNSGFTSILFDADSAGTQTINATVDYQKVTASVMINDLASIGDGVWNDLNQNGIQEAGEAGLPGVMVSLYNGTGHMMATCITDALGRYLFSNLIPGTYAVGFELPIRYVFSPQDMGSDDALDSDVNPITRKTVDTTLVSGENDLTWDAGMYMANQVPVAWNDYSALNPLNLRNGTSVTLPVLANDSDADADALAIISKTNGVRGTVTINPDGTVTYTHNNAAGAGSDQFTYTISDGHGGTATATVFVNILDNNVPTASNYQITTSEDTPFSGTISGTDPDGDKLTYNLGNGPANGIIVLNPDGTYTYTPNKDYYGPDSFTYSISDGHGGTAIATVSITVNRKVANIYVLTTVDKKNPSPGEIITVTFKLGNNGPDNAENVVFTYVIPEGMDLVNIETEPGYNKPVYNLSTRTITWTLGNVPVLDPWVKLKLMVSKAGKYRIAPLVSTATYNSANSSSVQSLDIIVSDSTTENVNAMSEDTIRMQPTGIPLFGSLLALLAILGGFVSTMKKQ